MNVDLTKYVPPFIVAEIKDMRAIYDVQSFEIDKINYCIEDIQKQFYIDTATWGLAYWEKRYGLETNINISYEQRREIIKAKKRGQGTTTKAMIKNAAEAFSNGEAEIIEVNSEGYFKIKFVGIKGIPDNMEAFKSMLEDIIPAHLGYVFEYTYTTWGEVKKATWGTIKTGSWGDLKTRKVI